MITLYLAHTNEGRSFAEHFLRERYALTEALHETEHGKPFFEGHPLFFNLSHSGGLLAIAVSDAEVGVDLQQIKRVPPTLSHRLHERERQEDFFALWTAKEAYVKYRGETLARLLSRLTYENGTLFLDGAPVSASLKHLDLSGFSLCVCSKNEQEVQLVRL